MAELRALGRRLASNVVWWGDSEVKERSVLDCVPDGEGAAIVTMREMIGVVRVGELQLQVVPKIPQDHFLYIARHSELFPRVDEQPTVVELGDSLWELVAKWYLAAAERLLRRELNKGYVEKIDDLDAVRGQLIPLRTAEAFYAGRLIAHCEFEDFNEDTPLNRVIRAAAERLAGSRILAPTLRRRALRILARCGGAGPLRAGDWRVQTDSLSFRYRDALAFARYILRGLSGEMEHGRHHGWSFLVRTPELVETGVREILRKGLAGAFAVAKKARTLKGTALTINPDLVFGDNEAIGDVKYKLIDSDWQRSDLYQVISFAAGFRTTKACLVTFCSQPDAALPTIHVGDIAADCFSWLASPSLSPPSAAAELVLRVNNWLRSAAIDKSPLEAAA
jgi:5-methylcytosine-specific restriction endonuclease McrBC regulatory subunit McrC